MIKWYQQIKYVFSTIIAGILYYKKLFLSEKEGDDMEEEFWHNFLTNNFSTKRMQKRP